LRQQQPTQADIRRSISALYYALFHELAAAGAAVFASSGEALRAQVVRAFAHATMREVCKTYVQARTGPFPKPYDTLITAARDPRLVSIAKTFIALQEARLTADYDLSVVYTRQEALDLLYLARAAHKDFGDIERSPDTQVFLTALLLADRWTRRG